MKFLDSNILIYAADETQPEKFERACNIVEDAISGRGYVISSQVLNEFASVMYRKLKKSDNEVRELISIARTIKTVPLLPEWTQLAIDTKERYGIQFYDALIVAAAEANGCDEILTEDLNDGQEYCGIRAVNPFK